jgi:cell division protein FtsL
MLTDDVAAEAASLLLYNGGMVQVHSQSKSPPPTQQHQVSRLKRDSTNVTSSEKVMMTVCGNAPIITLAFIISKKQTLLVASIQRSIST